ncbi:hypothetical protein THAOC_32807, partial [Thalassiosira oceanica]
MGDVGKAAALPVLRHRIGIAASAVIGLPILILDLNTERVVNLVRPDTSGE